MHQSATSLTIVRSSPAWKRVEDHYGTAFRFGRQAIEEAWRCGDALLEAKSETPHGSWLPALKAAGIAHETAKRFMRLRQSYPEIAQLGLFDTVSAALQLPQAQQHKPLSTKVRDPQPVFEAFRILDDILTKNSMSDCGLHFCVWFANGDGINRWMTVEFSVRSYADALQTAIKSVGQENHPELCRDADTLHQSTVLILNQYIDQARALALKDERMGTAGPNNP